MSDNKTPLVVQNLEGGGWLLPDDDGRVFRWPKEWTPLHPQAAYSQPMLGREALGALKRSIERHGLLEQIVWGVDGGQAVLVHGRNRYRACKELGGKHLKHIRRPVGQQLREAQIEGLTLDANLVRGHRTQRQRVATALVSKPKATGKTIAELVGCATSLVSHVKAGAAHLVAAGEARDKEEAYWMIAGGRPLPEGTVSRRRRGEVKPRAKRDPTRAEQMYERHTRALLPLARKLQEISNEWQTFVPAGQSISPSQYDRLKDYSDEIEAAARDLSDTLAEHSARHASGAV